MRIPRTTGAGEHTAKGLLLFIWVTSALAPPVTHAVTDERMAAAVHTGVHHALCGSAFLAGSMLTPPSPRCPDCRNVIRAHECATAPTPFNWFTRTLRQVKGTVHRTDSGS